MRYRAPIFALLSLLPSLVWAQPSSDWKTFRSGPGRFSVRAPGSLQEESSPQKPGDTLPVNHTFSLSLNDAAYIVTYTDFAPDQVTAANVKAILSAARDGGIKNVKGKLVSETSISVSGYPSRDVIASLPLDNNVGGTHFRLVLAKSRLYSVIFVGPGDSATRASVDVFLKSFQVLPDEPSDGWQTLSSDAGKFRIRMPGMPKEETSDLGDGIKIHQFLLDKGEYAYIVSYNGIASGPPNPEAITGLLNKGRDTMVASLKGKLVEEKSISLNGNSGKAIRVSMPDKTGTAYVRGYIVGDQYYQVMLIGSNKSLDGANGDRYFASFALVGGSSDGPWMSFSSKDAGFTVDLPGAPKEEKLKDGTAKFTAELGTAAYIVVVADLPVLISDPDKITTVLEAARDAELKVLSAKSIGEKRVMLGDNSGLQVNLSVPASTIPGGGIGFERYYVMGKKIYEVAVLTSDTKADEISFSRFFNSFRFAAP